jgi:AbiV family abortive infection protein
MHAALRRRPTSYVPRRRDDHGEVLPFQPLSGPTQLACGLVGQPPPRREHYPLATFTAILLLEEMGKVGLIWHELLSYDAPRSTVRELKGIGRDHRQKAFIAVVAGAVVNARLDRILGLKVVRQALQDAESGKLEGIRQACLYVDYVDGVVTIPGERIGREQAKLFVVLAGEIWAETYGHLPFEFERMIELVSAFEVELGYSREQIYGPGQAKVDA